MPRPEKRPVSGSRVSLKIEVMRRKGRGASLSPWRQDARSADSASRGSLGSIAARRRLTQGDKQTEPLRVQILWLLILFELFGIRDGLAKFVNRRDLGCAKAILGDITPGGGPVERMLDISTKHCHHVL
jgi:hypothetical protein